MQKTITIATSILVSTLSVTASAFELGNPITTEVKTHQVGKGFQAVTGKKEVVLMNIKLTPKERSTLLNYKPKATNLSANGNKNSQVNLGMNNVPVLDQGMHGSCVTFAVTGAINALLEKGDYISQLCLLELGNYLETNGYLSSGWDGSFAPWVNDAILRFGIVDKKLNAEDQTEQVCATVNKYPAFQRKFKGYPMPITDYKPLSEDLTQKYYPIYRMNFIDRFEKNFNDKDEAEKVLQDVKTALNNGHRLTVGTMLIRVPSCDGIGACAKFHVQNDTWALTKEIEIPYEVAGHELIIIGFDDNAEATDTSGKKHRGLLTLRNSWGPDVGDNGNLYMTYDYFKKFAGEVAEYVKMKPESSN